MLAKFSQTPNRSRLPVPKIKSPSAENRPWLRGVQAAAAPHGVVPVGQHGRRPAPQVRQGQSFPPPEKNAILSKGEGERENGIEGNRGEAEVSGLQINQADLIIDDDPSGSRPVHGKIAEEGVVPGNPFQKPANPS